jgi:hypothetical protein
MIARTSQTLAGLDIPKAFESYYGLAPQRYTLVLAPNLLAGAFRPSAPRPDGTRHYYSIQGAAGVADGYPHFGDQALQAIATQHTPSALVNFYAYRMSDLLELFYEPGRARWKDFRAFHPVTLLMFRNLSESSTGPAR